MVSLLSRDWQLILCLFSVQFSHSVTSDSLWSHWLQRARFPVHHQLLEPTQTHVYCVSDAIQPSHPLSSPSPPSFNLSQCLFQWIGSSHHLAKGHFTTFCSSHGLLGGSDDKVPACNVRDLGLIPGSGRSPGELATNSSILP